MKSSSSNAHGVIGQGIEVNGDVNFTGQLYVDGALEGNVCSDGGTLIVGKAGRVTAKIATSKCVIQGTVIGDIVASTHVEIAETGQIKGNVITPRLTLAEGAIVDGNISMGDQAGGLLQRKHDSPLIERAARAA